MQTKHILIGAGVALAVVVVLKRKTAAASAPVSPPKTAGEGGATFPEVVDKVGGVVKGVFDIFKSTKTAPAPTTSARNVPLRTIDIERTTTGEILARSVI